MTTPFGKSTFFGKDLGIRTACVLKFNPKIDSFHKRYVDIFVKGIFRGWSSHYTWVKIDLYHLAIIKVFGQKKQQQEGRRMDVSSSFQEAGCQSL